MLSAAATLAPVRPPHRASLPADVEQAIALYTAGLFPMDDPERPRAALPFYAADQRAVLELDAASRAALARRVRRSLHAGSGWVLRLDTRFDDVLDACARPRFAGDGVWVTPRLRVLYRRLHAAGYARSFELHTPQRLGAGLIAVLVGRAAMLETMTHWVPHAGNVLVARTLDHLANAGFAFADVQLPTPHTLRLGARLLPRAEFERRLRAAVS
jgi:leucyl/phenylalanyl-tRNA---protein transferase